MSASSRTTSVCTSLMTERSLRARDVGDGGSRASARSHQLQAFPPALHLGTHPEQPGYVDDGSGEADAAAELEIVGECLDRILRAGRPPTEHEHCPVLTPVEHGPPRPEERRVVLTAMEMAEHRYDDR